MLLVKQLYLCSGIGRTSHVVNISTGSRNQFQQYIVFRGELQPLTGWIVGVDDFFYTNQY